MDKMTFGKYKGWIVSDVLKEAGGKAYLRWAVEHVSFFVIDDHLRRIIGSPNRVTVDPESLPPLRDENLTDEMKKFIFT